MFINIKKFVNNSVFWKNIDNITYLLLLSLLFCSLFFDSSLLGGLSFLFCFFVLFRIVFSKEKPDLTLSSIEKTYLIYFLIVTVSLCASTLFKLSFHGYIKTITYLLFFYSCGVFFKYNKNKIFPTFLAVALFMSYESIIAIIQNARGVVEISGWQDMTNINPEQIISRSYGTLKPYNPNLLAGYLLCGLSSYIYLILNFLKKQKRLLALSFLILFFLSLIAIIDTGCRGAYLGFLFFFPCLFLFLFLEAKKYLNEKKVKKYKTVALLGLFSIFGFILSNPALIKRVQSIFSFRGDSSISFRMNVYESAFHMFLDNPFLGIGVGNQNFREIYGLYMKTGYDALGSYCVFLEMLVESGIFSLIVFLIFLFLVIKKCSRIEDKILGLCITLTMLATMGHGLFDTIWFRPQLQFLFWVNVAMLKIED